MSSRKRRLLLLSSSSLLWLTCCAGVAVSQPQNQQEQSPQTIAPATGAPGNEQAPAASEKLTSPQPADQTNPAAPAMPPGTMTVAPITVTAPTAPPRRTAPREAPPTTALPTRAARAPTPPPRSVQPSTPAAGVQSQTATFDQGRDNIFAPLGTAPSTLSREAIEALPQGTNTPVNKVLLQLPGVSQDSAASGSLHVRNEHANVSYRINGILLPDGLGAFGQYLDTSFIGSLTLITGALPAQYGLRTAGIVDITTAKFDNTGQISVYGGSRQTLNSQIQYGGVSGSTEYFFTGRYLENILESRIPGRVSTPSTIALSKTEASPMSRPSSIPPPG